MKGPIRLAVLAAMLLPSLRVARAEESLVESEVETQFIFGFLRGADVGQAGEKEIEQQAMADPGKRGGAYSAIFDQFSLEFVPVTNFRFELSVPMAFHDIGAGAGLDRGRQAALDGLSGEFRYKLLDRESSPFGLTVGAEPHWNRVDDISSARVDDYGGELSVAADKELVKDRLFVAVNLGYDPEVSRLQQTGVWQRQAALELSAALTSQVERGFFVGAEARYLLQYDGLGLGSFAGDALFIGPTFFVRITNALVLSGAFDMQAGGRASTLPGALDLRDFTRQQALFRLEYNF